MTVASQIDSGQNDCPKTDARIGNSVGLSPYLSCIPNIQVPSFDTRPRREAVTNDQGSKFRAYVARKSLLLAHSVTMLQQPVNPRVIYGGNMSMRRIILMHLELMQLC